jgi:hypothetical protein
VEDQNSAIGALHGVRGALKLRLCEVMALPVRSCTQVMGSVFVVEYMLSIITTASWPGWGGISSTYSAYPSHLLHTTLKAWELAKSGCIRPHVVRYGRLKKYVYVG